MSAIELLFTDLQLLVGIISILKKEMRVLLTHNALKCNNLAFSAQETYESKVYLAHQKCSKTRVR